MRTRPSLNLLDRALAPFVPGLVLRRLQARAAMELVTRRYEGAARGRRTAGWRTSPASANTLTYGDLPTLRDRSRDLARNNPWAKNALRVIDHSAVGTGIVPKILGGSASRRKEVAARWYDWSQTLECDADEANSFVGIQGLVARAMAEAGEVLVRRRDRRLSDGLAVPLQLQVLEPDHLDSTQDGERAGGGSYAVQGVEFDLRGRRTAYHLFRGHPGDMVRQARGLESHTVPAADIAHIYRVERAGQVRGVPWGSAAILRLRDFDEYEDAQLLRQKIAACFSAFVRRPLGGGGPPTDGKKDEHEDLEPGLIKYLGDGEEVTFGAPPGVEGLDAYAVWQLRAIAAGFGVSYEALTGDLSRVNFSSARMGWIFQEAEMAAIRQRILIPRLCARVFRWFLEAFHAARGVRTDDLWVEWTPPRRHMIDPSREVRPALDEVAGAMTSWSEMQRQRGRDPEDVMAEMAAERKELAALGITIPALAGSPAANAPPASKQETETDED